MLVKSCLQHFKRSKNINPFDIRRFSMKELLPKKNTASAKCSVILGRTRRQSKQSSNTLNPVWNFEALFPIEYYQGQQVKVELNDDRLLDDLNLDPLDVVHPKIIGKFFSIALEFITAT